MRKRNFDEMFHFSQYVIAWHENMVSKLVVAVCLYVYGMNIYFRL